MELLVGSISGGHFPCQLISLTLLTKNGYKPDLCMGGSGGAISIYCGLAANWSPSGIERVARSLDHSLFISDWNTGMEKYLPDYVLSYFYGSMYKTSDKACELLNTYFTRESIKETEIWSASINQNDGKVALFCNRGVKEATIKGEYLNRYLHNYEDVRYMDGDLDLITLSMVATSAIPMLVQPVTINEKNYVDCGTKYGSPLCPMYEEVMNISRKRGIRIVYMSGYNVQTDAGIGNGSGNMGDNLRTIPGHIVRSMIEQDRMCAYNIVNDWCDKEPEFMHLTGRDMGEALRISERSMCSLIEIYPTTEETIDIFSFTGDEVVRFMDSHSGHLGIRLWYS